MTGLGINVTLKSELGGMELVFMAMLPHEFVSMATC